MIKYLVPLICAALIGCSSPEAIRPFVAVGTANAIQYGVPATQRVLVAKDMVTVASLYNSIVTSEGAPNTLAFSDAMDKYLPDNSARAVTKANAVALYAVYYGQFKDKAPKVQMDYLTQFLLGVNDGASGFVR